MTKAIERAKIVFITLLVAGLWGCAPMRPVQLFDGPARGTDQVAVLYVPAEIDLLEIDGISVENYQQLLAFGRLEYRLLPGNHTLSVRYNKRWENEFGKKPVLLSQPATLALEAEAGDVFELVPEQPANFKQAKEYASNFTVTVRKYLVDQPQFPSARVQKDSQDAQTEVFQSSATRARGDIEEAAQAGSKGAKLSALELLKFWWLQADRTEQQNFIDWVNS